MHAAELIVAPEYRYFVADLLTNEILAELPFTGVSYKRAINAAGAFSGSIGVIPALSHLDIYNNTMPGKTALYVVRDGVCVWGGIIWSRSYSAASRTLTVNGAEFTSYLYHRNIWKTYSNQFTATVYCTSGSPNAQVVLDEGTYDFAVDASVKIVFYEVGAYQYSNYYDIVSTSSTSNFRVSIPDIPNGTYYNATIVVATDTYDFARRLLEDLNVDFYSANFPNAEIEPGIDVPYTIDSVQTSGTEVSLFLDGSHTVIPGQRVETRSGVPEIDGEYTVSRTTATSVTYPSAALMDPFVDFANSVDFGGQVMLYQPVPATVGTAIRIAVRVEISEIGYAQTLCQTLDGTLKFSIQADNRLIISGKSASGATMGGMASIDPVPYDVERKKVWLVADFGATAGADSSKCWYYYSLTDTNNFNDVSSITTLGAVQTGSNAGSTPDNSGFGQFVFGVDVATGLELFGRLLAGHVEVDGSVISEFDAGSIPLTRTAGQTVMAGMDLWLDATGSLEGGARDRLYSIGSDASNLTINDGAVPHSVPVISKFSTTNGTAGYWFVGNNNYGGLSQPDGTDISHTSLDIRWAGQLNSWTTIPDINGLISHGYTLGSGGTFGFYILTNGKLRFEWTTNGTLVSQYDTTAGVGAPSTGWYVFRVVVNTATSSVTFYKKETTPETAKADRESNTGWTSLTGTGTAPSTALFNTSDTLAIGRTMTTSLQSFNGVFLGADVRNSSGGAIVRSFDPALSSDSATSWTAAEGQTVTVTYHTTQGWKNLAYVGVESKMLFGSDNTLADARLELADGGAWPSAAKGATNSLTVVSVVRLRATWRLSNTNVLASKRPGTTTSDIGWTIRSLSSATDYAVTVEVCDGTTIVSATSPSVAAGALAVVGFVLDRTAKTLTAYMNGVAGTPTSYTTFGALSDNTALTVGRGYISTTGDYRYGAFDALVPIAIKFDALTAADMLSIYTDAASNTLLPSYSPSSGSAVYLVERNGQLAQYGSTSVIPLYISTQSIGTVDVVNGTTVTLNFRFSPSGLYNSFHVGELINVSGVGQYVGSDIVEGLHLVESAGAGYATYTVNEALTDGRYYRRDAAVIGTATLAPYLNTTTYGEFPGYADTGITFSTDAYSTKDFASKIVRGYEQKTVGQVLDEYTDTVNGFEFRVDCAYDNVTNTFTRTFVPIPIDFPDPPAAGEVSPISRYGADRYVFEYPGNIDEVTLDESAENAATRFFVVGNIDDLGADASQPYAAATATDLLLDGWPIIDASESRNNIYLEQDLYEHAERYLNEFRPPVADFKISVNGTLAPEVGTYNPGDWCAVIIDDEFVRGRLQSSLEPRSDVLVRKIEGIDVSVPDGVAFPEQVQLSLIPEWVVDRIGQ